jgi:hypothetical protein
MVNGAVELCASLTPAEQRQLVKEVAKSDDTRKAFAEAVKELRHERQDEKRERRDERESALAARQVALSGKRYGVILADPEWRFRAVVANDRDGPRPPTTTIRPRRSSESLPARSSESLPTIASCSCGRRHRCLAKRLQ